MSMPSATDADQAATIRLLDRFYVVFLAVGLAFLLIGVPFVFYRKAVSALACLVLISLVAAVWRMSRRGQPQQSLKLFAAGIWVILVGLMVGGLPPITMAVMLGVAVMLSVVVGLRAGIVYCASFMMVWLAYIVLNGLGLMPPAYFVGKPAVLWFIGAMAIWVVLLPIPTLVGNMRMALSLQRATLEAASDGILVIDMRRRVVSYNSRFASMWQVPSDVLAAGDDKAMMDCVIDQLAEPQQFLDKVAELYANPEASSSDTLNFKDGRVFERNSQPQRLEGKVSGRVWSFRDVTRRAAAERARAESEALKTSVLTHAAYAIIATDVKGTITVFNPYAETLLCYRADEVIGRLTPAVFHDAEEVVHHAARLSAELGIAVAPGFDAFVVKTRITGLPDENEWTYIRKDGRRVPVLLSVTAFTDAEGQISGYLGIATDISERRQAAARLAESQQRMELALAGADLGLLDWDIPTGKFVQNARFMEMLGYAPGELEINAEVFDWLIHPSDRDRVHKAVAAHFKGETPSYEAEHRTRHKDDHWVWILSRGKVVERDEHGRAVRMVGTVLDVTERKNGEASLKAREARLTKLIDSMQELVFVIDTEGRITEYHLPASLRFPVAAAAAVGSYFPDSMPEPLAEFITEAMVGIISDAQARHGDVVLANDGADFTYQVTLSQLSGPGKYATGFLALIRDISDRKRAEQEQRIASIAFEAQEGILITDADKVILRVNKAFSQITGYQPEEAIGQTTRLLGSGRHDEDFYAAMWKAINQTGAWQGEIWNRRKNGEIYPEWLTITAVKGEDGEVTHYVGTQTDITERKAAEAEIERLAYVDSLTQLANRRSLLDRMKRAMAFSARSGNWCSVLFLDLDKFKTLNDTLGHDMGDLLLQQVAHRLVSCVREGDTVARLGGDEFVVLLEGLSEDPQEAESQGELAGRKILATLNQVYMLGDHEYRSTPSIGGTLFRGNRHTMDQVMKQADVAMYQAKAAGRNALRFFTPDEAGGDAGVSR